MKILAIDTSGQQAGAAIVDEYITIGEIMINAQSGPKTWHHSEILMPAVERLFALSGQNIEDMDYVAYTAGPGSFTGIRIGAATALGLARSIAKPAIAVPTLDSLAYNVLGMGMLVVPLMDARRGQVYAAIYRAEHTGKFTRLTDYFAAPIEDVIKRVGELAAGSDADFARQCCSDVIFLGDGADAYKPEITSGYPKAKFAPANANRQRPASVGLCAIHQLISANAVSCNLAAALNQSVGVSSYLDSSGNPASIPELIYIRDPQAVRSNPHLKPKDTEPSSKP